MTTAELFIWIPQIFFTLMFVLIGILAFRHRSISQKFLYWLIGIFIVERVVEIFLRTYFTKQSLANYDPNSFAYLRLEALIEPSLHSLIIQQIVVFAIALAVLLVLMLYAKKTEYTKIDQADVLVFVLGTLVAGWPNFLIYIGLVFILATLAMLVVMVFGKNSSRMIVTPYFALAGIIVIFWGWEISKWVGLYALR